MQLKRYPVALYLVLVAAISTPYVIALAHSGSLDMGRGFVIHSLMWAPGVAGLICAWVVHRSLAVLGLAWGKTRYVVAGFAFPILYSLLAYIPLWLTHLAPAAFVAFAQDSAARLHMQGERMAVPAIVQVFLTLTFGVVQSAASAAGEEIGWRGYLVPALRANHGLGVTVVISGLIWAAWHMPVIFLADYHSAAPRGYAIACFTVMIVASGAIATWLRLRSGSVWPAIALHATHNAFVQWLLDPMTDSAGKGAWYAGEFGMALALATAAVAVGLFVARTCAPKSSPAPPACPS